MVILEPQKEGYINPNKEKEKGKNQKGFKN